jgi:ferredoxin
MPKLEINGLPVEVPEGTRLIQAAKKVGVSIPTMCYMEGLEPYTSCMICIVKDETKGKLVPGCSAMAEEGLKISTESEEVKKSRKFTLELLFSDHVGDCEAPCHRVCKSHINIPLMIRHIQDDDMHGAAEVVRESIGNTSLPCHGCEGTCEPGCRRGKAEAPVAIRQLVQYVHDWGAKKGDVWKPGENVGLKPDKRFNCAIGKLKEGEIDVFLGEASPIGRVEPQAGPEAGYTPEEALLEASRCMHCDCRKAETCSLRDYAEMYGIKQREFQPDDRSKHEQIRQHGDILYEPEKCIKCGLCIRVTEQRKEYLGLTWIGRGFDVTVSTPFNTELSTAVTTTAADCVDACPTAALSYRDPHAERRAAELRKRLAGMGQPVVQLGASVEAAGAVRVAPVSFGRPLAVAAKADEGGCGCGPGGCGPKA